MIHWNRESDNIEDVKPEVTHFFRFGLPEFYQASTLDDFYSNRREIIPTSRSGICGFLYNGIAFVSIGPGGLYTPLSSNRGSLRDLSGYFEVGLGKKAKAILPKVKDPL